MSNRASIPHLFQRSWLSAHLVPALAFVAVPLLAGCSAAREGNNRDNTPIISSNAHPLANDLAKTATVFADKLKFPLSSQNDLAEVQAGQILVSGYEHGFIRRVVGIESAADSILITTTDAELTDVVEQGQTSTTVDVSLLETASSSFTPHLVPQAPFGTTAADFSVDLSGQVIYAEDGFRVQITKGSLTFSPSLDIGISIRNARIDEFHAIAKGAFITDIQMEVEAASALQTTKEVKLWESPTVRIPLPPIGPIPIVCEGSLVVRAGIQFDANGNINVTLGQSFQANGEFGTRYTPEEGWKKVQSFEHQWTPEPPSLGADIEVQAKGYLKGSLLLGLYGGIKWLNTKSVGTGSSLDLSVTPYARMVYASSEPSPGWGVYGGVNIETTPSLRVLGNELLASTISLYETEERLLPNADPNEPPPINPGNCADGQENGVESSVDCGGSCAADCGDGEECVGDNDCMSGTCESGSCVPVSCANGVMDAGEESVDCGGSCPACAGATCTDAGDCAGANCMEGVCEESYQCSDGELNGSETDVDCGGTCGVCPGTFPLNCDDGEWNGDEEDLDCGGSCPPCMGGGNTCDGSGDCQTCNACADMGACAPSLEACNANADCISLWTCLSSCLSGDTACESDCYVMNPNGENDYIAYVSCVVCSECFSDCGGAGQCQ